MKLLLALLSLTVLARPDNLPPVEYQKLARDIYKQLIEINTSFSTGSTTPAAQAVADRLPGRGISGIRHHGRRRGGP